MKQLSNKNKAWILILVVSLIGFSYLAYSQIYYTPEEWAEFEAGNWENFVPWRVGDEEVAQHWENFPPEIRERYLQYKLGTQATFSIFQMKGAKTSFNPSTGELSINYLGMETKVVLKHIPPNADVMFDPSTRLIIVQLNAQGGTGFVSSESGELDISPGNLPGYFSINGHQVNFGEGSSIDITADGNFKVSGSVIIDSRVFTPLGEFEYTVKVGSGGRMSVTVPKTLSGDDALQIKFFNEDNEDVSSAFLIEGSVDVSAPNFVFGRDIDGKTVPTKFEISDPDLLQSGEFRVTTPTELAMNGNYCTTNEMNCITVIKPMKKQIAAAEFMRSLGITIKEGMSFNDLNNQEKKLFLTGLYDLYISQVADKSVLSIKASQSDIEAHIFGSQFDYIWAEATGSNEKIDLFLYAEEGKKSSKTKFTISGGRVKEDLISGFGLSMFNSVTKLMVPSSSFDPTGETPKGLHVYDYSSGKLEEVKDFDWSFVVGPAFDIDMAFKEINSLLEIYDNSGLTPEQRAIAAQIESAESFSQIPAFDHSSEQLVLMYGQKVADLIREGKYDNFNSLEGNLEGLYEAMDGITDPELRNYASQIIQAASKEYLRQYGTSLFTDIPFADAARVSQRAADFLENALPESEMQALAYDINNYRYYMENAFEASGGETAVSEDVDDSEGDEWE